MITVSTLTSCNPVSAPCLGFRVPQDIRIAVLTDVHGNAFAAEAVSAEILRSGPDIVLNLGDQLWGQADPVGALHWQSSLKAVEVRGNNDERLTDTELSGSRRHIQAWLRGRLPEGELQRLAALPCGTACCCTGMDGTATAAQKARFGIVWVC